MTADRQDIVERLRAQLDTIAYDWQSAIRAKDAITEITSLRAENNALRKDAERYRWLREHGGGIEVPDDTYPNQIVDLWLANTALDKEVDDAIARAALANRPAEPATETKT